MFGDSIFTSSPLGFAPKSLFESFDLPRQIPLAIGDAENVDEGKPPKDSISSDKITHLKTSNRSNRDSWFAIRYS
jgi:hypothetical protein